MRLSDRAKYYLGATACVAVALAAGPALAQQSGGLDRIVDVYRDGASAWGPSLRQYAISLFGLLATIEFVWSFARLTIKGADFGEFVGEFFTRLMFIGFFYWLMIASAEIAPAVVNSFREAGNTAAQAGGGSGGMRPSDIWRTGVDVGTRVLATETGLDVGKALGIMLAGLILIVCFALMAAAMIIALVEGYIIMNAGILLMGFGGSRWTKDIAVKTLTYAVSVGAKLFVIQILVGMAEAMVKSWTGNLGTGAGMSPDYMGEILEIVGASIVMLALTYSIPGIVQGIVNGTSPGSHNALTGATAAVAGAVGGGMALAAGGAMAGSGAMKLASEQMKAAAAAGDGPSTGMGRVGAFIGASAKNLGKSALNDVGANLSGRVRAGNSPARMGASMLDEAKHLKAERERPSAAPMAAGTSAPQPEMAMAGGADGGASDAAGTIRPESAPDGGGQGGAAGGADDVIHGAAPTPEPMLGGASNGASDQPRPYEATYGASYGSPYGQADPEVGGGKATAPTVEGADASAGPSAAATAIKAGAGLMAGAADADTATAATIEGAPSSEGAAAASPTASSGDSGTISGAASTQAQPANGSATQGPPKGLGGALGRGSGPGVPPKKPGGR